MQKKFLFYISQNYSFEILRPLQKVILARGDHCAWFVEGSVVNTNLFQADDVFIADIKNAIAYQPHAVFVPGNIVPEFISGLKVQVFHGLEYKKKGHFRIRGFFDLYCTHGPITTNKFKELATEHGHFNVIETGWSKLDPLFSASKLTLKEQGERPCILYAPTFSPKLTSSIDLFPEIQRLAERGDWFWLVKFHPKMAPELAQPYLELAKTNPNIVVSSDAAVAPLLQTADVIVSDTSSIIGEFILLDKPAVTYRNSAPGAELLDFSQAEQLENQVQTALHPSSELLQQLTQAKLKLHPYQDGQSSERILAAVDAMLPPTTLNLKAKPLNLLRKLKLRKRLNYWGW